MPSVLNSGLFEDENAYWAAVTGLLETPPSIPKAVRDVGQVVVLEIFAAAGWTKTLKKYVADIAESSAIGYMVVVSEDWSDLDRGVAVARMDEGLRMIQEERRSKGLDQISLGDVDNAFRDESPHDQQRCSSQPSRLGVRFGRGRCPGSDE